MKTQMLPLFLPLTLGLLPLATGTAEAHPTMLRHGYQSCAACHSAPQGQGALNDYGKSIAAAMSLLSAKDITEAAKPLRHGLQARVMYVTGSGSSALFPMQLDYLGQYEKEKDRLDLTLGVQGRRSKASAPPNEKFQERLVIRKLGYARRPEEGTELSAGRDALPMGIGTDDHTSFLRARLRRGVNDYVTKTQLDRWEQNFNYALFAFGPSFEEKRQNREYGLGGRYERAALGDSTFGATAFGGISTAIKRAQLSAFSRVVVLEKLTLLAEHSLLRRWVRAASTGKGFDQQVSHARLSYFPADYLETSLVGELLHVEAPFAESKRQFGPSLNFRVHKNISLLADGRRIETQGGAREKRLALQLYGHF